MADDDDAQSPTGEEEAPSRGAHAHTRGHGPIGKAVAWFSAQPAQTKVLLVGVVLVLGVVIVMAFKKKANPVSTEDAPVADNSPIPTSPAPPGTNPFPMMPPVPISTGPLNGPGAPPFPTMPPSGPPDSGPTGIRSQPAASPAVARWRVTPGGVSDPYSMYNVMNAGHRQDVSTTGPLQR